MDNNQITALARELAEELYNDDKSYNTILWWCKEPKERKAEELEYTLRFLLRRYCLVEKVQLIAHYNMAKANIKPRYLEACQYEVGATDVLKSLFPEIAKEVK